MDALKNIIWFEKPGDFSKWEQQCQPIGNGFLGLSFFGGISREKVVLNEKTLWVGGPSPDNPHYNGGNKTGAYAYVKQVQELLYDGKYNEALELLPNLTGLDWGSGAYQLLADLYMDFEGIDEKDVSDYKRSLDMDRAVFETEFACGGVKYTRSAFASYPARAACIVISADKPGKISVKLSLGEIQQGGCVEAKGDTLYYYGALRENGLRYAAQFRLEAKGGQTVCGEDSIEAKNADRLVIYFTAATDYAPDMDKKYRSGKNPMETVEKIISEAAKKGAEELYREHEADYTALFDRCKLNLNGVCGMPPAADVLVEQYREKGDEQLSSTLEALYFQFGRYMLIGSSRSGTLPANLQGVWNESNCPPWCCDYHINVNLQMNYWGAYNTNLAETAYPLVDFLDDMRPAGRITAKEYYNIVSDEKNPENGWIAHTTTTPFGWTAPGWDFYWGWSTAAVAWLMQNIWEYYEFTEDREYFEKRIYPIMRESVRFYLQWLIFDDKQQRLVSTPTYSPEHGPVTVGNTYEQSLIEQLYRDFITASEALGKDEELRRRVQHDVELLKPYHVGKTGMIKEWYEEDEPDFDRSKIQPNHRHISHLLGLYPGKAITSKTPELMEAAINTMNDRGDESTGWARAYKLNLWTRTGDGNRAYKLLHGLLASCTFPNLFDFHPPFQLDGNFGGSAGIAEMLLQSHEGFIKPLAALPERWKKGAFSGLCARGGFVLDAEWDGGELTDLEICAKRNNPCRLMLKKQPGEILCGGEKVPFSAEDGLTVFEAEAGKKYTVRF